MLILRQIRKIPFVRPRVRFFQSSAVIFRAHVVQTPPTIADHNTDNTVAEERALFNDDTRIFAVKRTRDILRSLFVLKLCSYDVVARKSMVVRNMLLNMLYVIAPSLNPIRSHSDLTFGPLLEENDRLKSLNVICSCTITLVNRNSFVA